MKIRLPIQAWLDIEAIYEDAMELVKSGTIDDEDDFYGYLSSRFITVESMEI